MPLMMGILSSKSFGKFWGLAGMRLGAVIVPKSLAPALRDRIGPWAVSGPALYTGTRALQDAQWANDTRQRLAEDAQKLDQIMLDKGARTIGGTHCFASITLITQANGMTDLLKTAF